jgi:hypothetical protein
VADDDNTEDKSDETTDESTDETTDESTEGARDEASDGSDSSDADEEESDAKTGNNSEDQTPKSEIDDPDFGKKEDEPANETQMKYLKPLAEDMGEEIPDDMSEADAASKINEMQEEAAS